MDELKPCPFCGSSGAILDEPLNEDEYGCFCNALCGAIGPCDEDGEKAVEFWNTRPLEDALNARIAELEAHIAELEAHIAALEEAADIEEWDDFPNFPEPPEVKE